jgi:hypothetical protein
MLLKECVTIYQSTTGCHNPDDHNMNLHHLETLNLKMNSCSANQEIPSLLQKLKVHCHLHKSPPLDPVLSQMNPVHNPRYGEVPGFCHVVLSYAGKGFMLG